MKTFYSFSAGILIRGQVRDFLKECKFHSIDIEWIETKGFLESHFTIKGSKENVGRVASNLIKWAKENDL